MNIFYLDHDPALAAQYHCDKHVVKMILELGQLLSTAHRLQTSSTFMHIHVRRGNPVHFDEHGCLKGKVVLKPYKLQYLKGDKIRTRLGKGILTETYFYRATHENHPCAKWVRESRANYCWTHALLEELCREYTHRYGKVHKMQSSGLLYALDDTPIKISHMARTPVALAMPDEYKRDCPVEAYRAYYNGAKKALLSYKNRTVPYWVEQ
jgi:hypothetical protein